MYQPKHIAKWKLPEYYFGEHWDDYYVFLGHHRDSDNLDNSNFDCALQALGGESETVIVVTENHWAVGWVQWIAIHESDEVAIRSADEMKERLADYPILNEDDYNEREWKDFSYNCEQAVRDYCRTNYKRFTWKLVRLVQDTQSDCSSETWPDESEIAVVYSELHNK